MWADAPANRPSYATGNAKFNTWKTQELDAYMPPGRSSAVVSVVSFTPTQLLLAGPGVPVMSGHRVTVQIQWRAPNEPDSAPAHTYSTSTDIVS